MLVSSQRGNTLFNAVQDSIIQWNAVCRGLNKIKTEIKIRWVSLRATKGPLGLPYHTKSNDIMLRNESQCNHISYTATATPHHSVLHYNTKCCVKLTELTGTPVQYPVFAVTIQYQNTVSGIRYWTTISGTGLHATRVCYRQRGNGI